MKTQIYISHKLTNLIDDINQKAGSLVNYLREKCIIKYETRFILQIELFVYNIANITRNDDNLLDELSLVPPMSSEIVHSKNLKSNSNIMQRQDYKKT